MFKTLIRKLGRPPRSYADYERLFSPDPTFGGWARGDGGQMVRGDGWSLWNFNDAFKSDLFGEAGGIVRNSLLYLDEADGSLWWLSSGGGEPNAGSETFPNVSPTNWAWPQGGWVTGPDSAIYIAGTWVTGSPYSLNGYRAVGYGSLSEDQPSITSSYTVGLDYAAGVSWAGLPFVEASYVYVFGIHYGELAHYLARHAYTADASTLSTGWEYWTGSGWSTNIASRGALTIGSAGLRALNVVKYNDKYLFSSKLFDAAPELDIEEDQWPDLWGWEADSITGPLTSVGSLRLVNRPGWFSYASHAFELPGVPGLSAIWSLNTNESSLSDNYIYGPHFGAAGYGADMSRNVIYVGTAHGRVVSATDFNTVGVSGEPTRTWDKSNGYEQVVSDAAATYLLAQNDFVDEEGLSFPSVIETLFNEGRFDEFKEKIMKFSGTGGDWRTWNVALSRRAALPADIVLWGDSIGEGWTSVNGPAPQDQVYPKGERDQHGFCGTMRRLLQLTYNDNGRGGQWVPAGNGWWGPGIWKFSANGSDTEVNQGISLRGRQMAVANANPASITVIGDSCEFFYNKINLFGACDLQFKVDGGLVQQVATYDGALPAFGTEAYSYKWTGTRGLHTFSVEAVANGGFNTQAQFLGAYIGDGDDTKGVRVWNGSHFGYNLTHWITAGVAGYSMISKGLLKPDLHILALGTNDTPSTYATNLAAFVTMINAATDLNGQKRPPWVILTPPAAGTNPNSIREPMRQSAYDLAEQINGEVWEWNELQGSVAVADGSDPYDITYNLGGTEDNIHPGGAGHRAVGEYAAGKVMFNSTVAVGIQNLDHKINSGRRLCKQIGAMGTAQTLDASQYENFAGTLSANVTLTLSGALAGDRRTRIVVYITQDSTARTVTFSPTVKWASGTAYTASTGSGAKDRVILETADGGTNWFGTFDKGFA